MRLEDMQPLYHTHALHTLHLVQPAQMVDLIRLAYSVSLDQQTRQTQLVENSRASELHSLLKLSIASDGTLCHVSLLDILPSLSVRGQGERWSKLCRDSCCSSIVKPYCDRETQSICEQIRPNSIAIRCMDWTRTDGEK